MGRSRTNVLLFFDDFRFFVRLPLDCIRHYLPRDILAATASILIQNEMHETIIIRVDGIKTCSKKNPSRRYKVKVTFRHGKLPEEKQQQ